MQDQTNARRGWRLGRETLFESLPLEIKKEHFVPQFYLRRFANSDRVNVYDKALGRSFGAHVRDIASERYFYDIPQLDALAGCTQALEKHFHPFEEAGSAAIATLVTGATEKRGFRVRQSVRTDLSIYLALQHLRTRESREVIVQLADGVTRELFMAHLRERLPGVPITREQLLLESTDERRRGLHAIALLDPELRDRVAESFFRCRWVLLRNTTDAWFYTSDQPVAYHNGLLGKPLASPIVNAVGSEIAFPLTPTLLLVMFDRVAYPQARRHDGRVCDIRDPRHVEYYNSLQVIYAHRQIYSVRPDFSLPASMRAESPGMANVEFRRVELRLGG